MRHVIKIDIQQEHMDIQSDRDVIPFLVHDAFDHGIKAVSDFEDWERRYTEVTQEIYKVIEIADYRVNQRRAYLLKRSDENIFNELLQINRDQIEALKHEAADKAYRDGVTNGRELGEDKGFVDGIAAFKQKPWYMRLLGRF